MSLVFLRHPKVIKSWQNKCYGHSDIGICRAAMADFMGKLDGICAIAPDVIIHSDLKRTAIPARIIADKIGITPCAEPLWRERNFGIWEGQSWQKIYRTSGNAMDGFINAPNDFAPENGETTGAIIGRVKTALERSAKTPAKTLIIAHGGTIAIAQMLLQNLGIKDLPSLIPQTSQLVYGKA